MRKNEEDECVEIGRCERRARASEVTYDNQRNLIRKNESECPSAHLCGAGNRWVSKIEVPFQPDLGAEHGDGGDERHERNPPSCSQAESKEKRVSVVTSERRHVVEPAPGSVSKVAMMMTFDATGAHAAARNRRNE